MSAQNQRHRVFISYSSKDRVIADAVREHLQGNGITCWMAPHSLLAGTDWAAAIIDAIDESQALLLILSEASNVSDDVKKEVGRASAKGVAIVPFFIENVRLTRHMEYFLGTTHWLGADSRHIELRMAHLLETVRGLLREPGPDAITAPAGIPIPAPPRAEPTAAPAAGRLTGEVARHETTILNALRPFLRFPPEDPALGRARPMGAAIAALVVGGLGILFCLQGFFSALFPGMTPESYVFTMFPMLRITTAGSAIASGAGNLGLLVGGHRMFAGTADGPAITMAAVRWMAVVAVVWFGLTLVSLMGGPAPVRGPIMNATLTTAFLAAIQIGIVWKLASGARR
jgi:hypothetical protein